MSRVVASPFHNTSFLRAKDVDVPAVVSTDKFVRPEEIVTFLEERRLSDVVALDVKEKIDYCDHVILATGQSSRQINALGRAIVREVRYDI